MVRALVIRAAGINCEQEMARGFRMAGAHVDLLHIQTLAQDPRRIERYGVIGFPGGFSFGDDVASGRILALLVRKQLYPALRRAAERGVPMLGICNGFQVLTQAGLLPGPNAATPAGPGSIRWPEQPCPPTVALCENQHGRYEDRWVRLRLDPASPCLWTQGLEETPGPPLMLPVGHGEGRFYADEPTIAHLIESGQAPLRYVDNFNGSAHAIAGVCDPTGRILGLMPHPDRFLDWNRHPQATRLDLPALADHQPAGLRMFTNAVRAAAEVPTATASVAQDASPT